MTGSKKKPRVEGKKGDRRRSKQGRDLLTILEALELEMSKTDFKKDASALEKFWKPRVEACEEREQELYRLWEQKIHLSTKKH